MVGNLYFSAEGQENPYPAYTRLIEQVEHPNHRYRANCLASATYMSYVMRKLGGLSNILIYLDKGEEGKTDYHAALLYEYKGELLVCDITYHCRYSFINDFLLVCPFENYTEIYELITGNSIDNQEAYIYDTNITPMSGYLNYVNLADWNPEKHGLYSYLKFDNRVEYEKEKQQKLWLKKHPGKF